MTGDETNPHPIQLIVNYWGIRPATLGARLDELVKSSVSEITTFVPWQAVESDISHSLIKFLQAAYERKLKVNLILSPEVGVHYPNSGLPKDLFTKLENTARDGRGGIFVSSLPPNSFSVPSLSSPDFAKRFQNFLIRMDGILADLSRNQTQLLDRVSVILTGSFWKYYRQAQFASQKTWGGASGDYSNAAAVQFRQRIEQFFAQREFSSQGVVAMNRWKSRQLEDVNRRWFNQHQEDAFRTRSSQLVRKKAIGLNVRQIELFTPEADPSILYSNLFQMMTGDKADFARLGRLLEDSSSRASYVGEDESAPFVHWTELGGFRTISDSEKQYLIIQSLLLMGARGGGIYIDESEWFSLSPAFRARAEALGRLIAEKQLALNSRATYLSTHLWSGGGTLWDEVLSKNVPGIRFAASVDGVTSDQKTSAIIVDPQMIIAHDPLEKMLSWARRGGLLALPRNSYYTDSAQSILEQYLDGSPHIEMNLGVSYRVQGLGEGQVVLYEVPENAASSDSHRSWQIFAESILSMAGVESQCSISDSRLKLMLLTKPSSDQALFIMNSSNRAVTADIIFTGEVTVSDLAGSFGSEKNQGATSTARANRFSLEVPPFGILPLSVEGLGDEARERRAAALTSELMKKHSQEAAASELPGFNSSSSGMDSAWN